MSQNNTVQGADKPPQYARAKAACAHFAIARSTLWHWVKTRPDFPAPVKAGVRVTIFDISAIDAYIKSQGGREKLE